MICKYTCSLVFSIFSPMPKKEYLNYSVLYTKTKGHIFPLLHDREMVQTCQLLVFVAISFSCSFPYLILAILFHLSLLI